MNGLSIADFLTKIASEGQGTCSLCTLLLGLEPRSPAVQWPALPLQSPALPLQSPAPPSWRRQTPASSSRVAHAGPGRAEHETDPIRGSLNPFTTIIPR